MKKAVLIVFIFLLYFNSHSQIVGELDDTGKFLAETKQLNQFFRRFNGEEDEKGNRYYPGDKDYRSPSLRKSFLKMLFDFQNADLDKDQVKQFINIVNEKNNPQYLDFHGDDWFAQVSALFNYEGQERQAVLYLKLEQERLGYKWVISKVFFAPFLRYFINDTSYTKKFLHPMSHELDFMNLRKAFADRDSVEQFVAKEFRPDYLTLFLYEMRRGKLSFITVRNVRFHFFQIDNWYFDVSYFNREGYNTGWLISNLVNYKPGEEKLLRDFIFYEN